MDQRQYCSYDKWIMSTDTVMAQLLPEIFIPVLWRVSPYKCFLIRYKSHGFRTSLHQQSLNSQVIVPGDQIRMAFKITDFRQSAFLISNVPAYPI